NHTNRPLTDFGGKTSIFSHPVYLFLREFSLQDFRGGSPCQNDLLFLWMGCCWTRFQLDLQLRIFLLL
ncbi:hypothetical protein MMN50_20715, partial [Escherichia coli]|uniref:hypothetical protein n=1 Tax=Escherichia coli TaxID=562 RepID=UPI001F11555C